MRYAFISDVHSNWEALQAVFQSCQEQDVHRIFCVGDIVGYGANPKECIDLIQSQQIISVAGNHDWAACGKLNTDNFNPAAKAAIDWTRAQLDSHEVEYLKQLPVFFREDSFVMAHASLHKPSSFHYIKDIVGTVDTFYLMKENVCFIGHTHVPKIYRQKDSRVEYVNLPAAMVEPGCKYIVNVGSVGQPRDGNPLACYCIYDIGLSRVDIVRIPYSLQETRRKILEAQLPDTLAQRLLVGH